MSGDPGVWVAALLTFAILTFLHRDNPLFRLAEHLFVGVASGYVFVLAWKDVVRPNLVERLLDPALPYGERLLLLVPLALGLCMLSRAFPRVSSLSRIASAFIVGFVVGTNVPLQLKVQVLSQLASTVADRPLLLQGALAASNWVFVVGVLSVLVYFVFTVPRQPGLRRSLEAAGTLGRLFLMVAFGATFGNTVMARVSILIGRVQFLLRDWLQVVD